MKLVKEDGFLSDIENDIDSDWREIQKNIQDKEQTEIIKENPQRFHFPRFKEFYKILFNIFTSFSCQDGKYSIALSDLHVLIRRIFNNHDNDQNPMPKAFDRVWEIFCNPIKFKCYTGIRCKTCNKRHDVLVEHEHTQRIYTDRFELESDIISMHYCDIRCPLCGYSILQLSGAKLVGVFNHVHVDEREEYKKPIGGRGNGEFRSKFRNYF